MLPREVGYEIGTHLESRKYKAALGTLEAAIATLAQQDTIRDYSEPVADICTDPRIINLFEVRCGVVTVEDYYRTCPRQIEHEREVSYAPKGEYSRQCQIIEAKYSGRLQDKLSSEAVEMLLNAGIINIWDLCNTAPGKLVEALEKDPSMVRDVRLLRREHE